MATIMHLSIVARAKVGVMMLKYGPRGGTNVTCS